MARLVMGREEIAPDHIEIAIVYVTVIFSDESFTVRFVPCRNFVPSHSGLFVMGRVKIVIKKEWAQKCGVLNKGGAFMHIVGRAVFGTLGQDARFVDAVAAAHAAQGRRGLRDLQHGEIGRAHV